MPLRYESQSDVTEIYRDRVKDLIKYFQKTAQGDVGNFGGPWAEFDQGVQPFDNDHPTKLFDREEANKMFVKSTTIKDDKTGAVGDQIVCFRQIEYLAALERAYRNRYHASPVRAMAHRAATSAGFGRDNGVIAMLHLEELYVISKATKAKKDDAAE